MLYETIMIQYLLEKLAHERAFCFWLIKFDMQCRNTIQGCGKCWYHLEIQDCPFWELSVTSLLMQVCFSVQKGKSFAERLGKVWSLIFRVGWFLSLLPLPANLLLAQHPRSCQQVWPSINLTRTKTSQEGTPVFPVKGSYLWPKPILSLVYSP